MSCLAAGGEVWLIIAIAKLSRDIPEYFGEELEDFEKRKVFAYHTARYIHGNHRVEHIKTQRRGKCYLETPKVRPRRRSPSIPLRDILVNNGAAPNRRAVSCQPTSSKSVKSPPGAALPLKRIRKPTPKAQAPLTVDRNSPGKKKEFKLPQIPEIQRRHQTPSVQGTSIAAPLPAVEARSKQAPEIDESELTESSDTSGAIVGLAAIRDFLSTCQPCMAHHYRHLVDVGCVNEQHLFSISTWDRDKRFETLKKMLPGLTPMDIMFLNHHFETYFGHYA